MEELEGKGYPAPVFTGNSLYLVFCGLQGAEARLTGALKEDKERTRWWWLLQNASSSFW